jgi:hypothetical protein
MVRGQWIVERYFKAEKTALVDGWFPTGDIATIDANGTMQIRDRTKDVIKTGGEWISSIDLENAAIGHPAVAMAAVIGVKHPKWDERPLLFIVRKPGQALEKQEILDFLATKVAKWWVPDDVVFLESLPVGGTGKVQKERPAQGLRRRVQLIIFSRSDFGAGPIVHAVAPGLQGLHALVAGHKLHQAPSKLQRAKRGDVGDGEALSRDPGLALQALVKTPRHIPHLLGLRAAKLGELWFLQSRQPGVAVADRVGNAAQQIQLHLPVGHLDETALVTVHAHQVGLRVSGPPAKCRSPVSR